MDLIGAGGATLSLGLSLYNSSEIFAIKNDLEQLIKTESTEKPLTTSTIPVTEASSVSETTFKTSDSEEVTELQASVKELEVFANVLSTQASTNSSNIGIKSDEIDNLNVFVGNQFVDVRGRIAVTEDNISKNASDIEKLESLISSTTDASLVTNDRIDATKLSIDTTNASLEKLYTRASLTDSSIEKLSNDLTQRGLDIDSLGDEVSLRSNLLDETRLSLENMYSLWNGFNKTAFVADDALNVSGLNASNCNIGLSRDDGSKSAIHFNTLGSSNYSMYMAETGVGLGTSGESVQKHGDVTRYAIRTRLGSDARDGFIFEDSTGTGVASISSSGAANFQTAKIGDSEVGTACFSNKARFGNGFLSYSDGKCAISAGNSKTVELINNGNRVLYTTKGRSVIIENDDSTNPTIFNYNGSNYIRTSDDGSVNFSWGTGGTTVKINDGQILVDGVDLLSEIVTLKSQVASLQSKSYLLNGTTIYLENQNNGKLVRKADKNNDIIVDSGSRNSKSRFRVLEV